MSFSTSGFSLAEKLAVVQALNSVILADGTVHNGEINMMSTLMHRLDFDSNFLVQARNLSLEQCSSILDEMSNQKKIILADIMDNMAKADGFVHRKEIEVISSICKAMKIYDKIE